MAGRRPTEPAVEGERGTPPEVRAARIRDTLLVVLAFGAGSVDAISYLGLGQIFTANMTGNTVLLGVAAAQGDALRAVRSGVAFAGFAVGVLVASLVVGAGHEDSAGAVWPRRVTPTLALEMVVLTAFLAGWEVTGADPSGAGEYVLVGVSAVAMGAPDRGCPPAVAFRDRHDVRDGHSRRTHRDRRVRQAGDGVGAPGWGTRRAVRGCRGRRCARGGGPVGGSDRCARRRVGRRGCGGAVLPWFSGGRVTRTPG